MAERQLKVTIVGDDRSASRALKNVGDTAERTGASSKVAGNALDDLTSRMTQNLGPAADVTKAKLDQMGEGALSSGNKLSTGLAVGATAAGVAIAAFAAKGIRDFLNLTDEVDGLQDVLGNSAEEASKLRNIGAALGVETDKLGSSMFKLSQNIDKGKLAEFGVEVARSKDGTVDLYGTLLNLSDVYNSIQDPVQRNVLLTEAFGKSGKDLIDILEVGREELEKYGKAGPIFSQKNLDDAREFRIAMEQLKMTTQDLGTSVGSGAVPFLTDLINVLSTLARQTQSSAREGGFLSDTWEKIKLGVRTALPPLAALEFLSKDNSRAQAEMKVQLEEAARAMEQQQQEADALAQSQLNLVSSTLGLAGAHHSAAGAVLAVEKAQQNYNDAVAEYGPNSAQAREAEHSLEGARLSQIDTLAGLAQKLADVEVNQLRANGVTVTAQQEAGLYRQKLLEVANTVENPLKGKLIELANTISDVPPGKNIHFTTNAGEATAVVAGFRDTLFSIPVVRNVQINTSIVGGVLPGTAGSIAGRHQGGPVHSHQAYIVGEHGPELLQMGAGSGYVVDANRTRRILNESSPYSGSAPAGTTGGGGLGAVVVDSSVYLDSRRLARGTSRHYITELRRHIRRNGGRI